MLSTEERIRPLHIGKFVPPPYAGVEAHVDTLLSALAPYTRATLLAGESAATRHRNDTAALYRIVTAKSYGRFASVTLSPGVLLQARQELLSGRSNLLHIHAPNPWGDLAALTCGPRVPVVMTWHSDIVRQKKLMIAYRKIQRQALRRADRIVVFTPKHYESSEQLGQLDLRSKIVTIPIGIDFDRLDRKFCDFDLWFELDRFANGRPIIATVGRHVYYKGYQYLLAALSKGRSDAVLVLAGSGPLTPQLERQVIDLGLQRRVLFLGEVSNAMLATVMNRCDVFCLPSIERSEAFGIASAEAMACGKPTVVCELGNGVNYLNQANLTSLTVPARSPDALADALDTLVADDALRTRLGAAASRWVRERFSIAAMRDGMIDLYRQLT